MSKFKKKKGFVTPFYKTSCVITPNVGVNSRLPPRNKDDNKTMSPVYLGRHVQTITPHTRQKIKQRFAYGFSHVSIKDVSPGVYVPFEFSQASCISGESDDTEERIAREEHDEIEHTAVTKKEDLSASQNVIDTEEDSDIECLHELYEHEYAKTSVDRIADSEQMDDTEYVGKNADIITSDAQGSDIEFDISNADTNATDETGTVTENLNATVKPASIANQENLTELGKGDTAEMMQELYKQIEKPELAQGYQAEEMRSEKEDTSNRKKCNKKDQNSRLSGKIYAKKKKSSKLENTMVIKIQTERFMLLKGQKNQKKVGNLYKSTNIDGMYKENRDDFSVLSSSRRSRKCNSRKKKQKRTFEMMKKEVLKTLNRMHLEIQELLERRKQLNTSSHSPPSTDKGRLIKSLESRKQHRNAAIQEE